MIKYLLGITGLLWLPAILLLLQGCEARWPEPAMNGGLPLTALDSTRAEAALANLSLEEKIGQLIIWKADSRRPLPRRQIKDGVEIGKVGGVLLSGLVLEDYLRFADSLKNASYLPLFFATSEKVSLHNQFSDISDFPLPMTMAAIDSPGLHLELERHYIRQCKALGINFCFNPSLASDEATRTAPSFDYQQFEQAGTTRSLRMTQRLRRNRIAAVADDLHSLCFVESDSIRDSLLAPLRMQSAAGLSGFLLDGRLLQLDTLRELGPGYIRRYLRRDLQFGGLAVATIDQVTPLDLSILRAADLFVTNHAPSTFAAIHELLKSGQLEEEDLDERVFRVLLIKSWTNGGDFPPAGQKKRDRGSDLAFPARLVSNPASSSENLPLDNPGGAAQPNAEEALSQRIAELSCYFKHPHWDNYIGQLFESAVILARDQEKRLPFADILKTRYEVYAYSRQPFDVFRTYFRKYADLKLMPLPPDAAGGLPLPPLAKQADGITRIILLDSLDLKPGLHRDFINLVNDWACSDQVVLINFGNPKNLQYLDMPVSCIQIFQRNEITESFAAQLLFGGVAPVGRLPLEISSSLPFGASLHFQPTRLSFGAPEKAGIRPERLVGIDAIAESAVDQGVFPGCQVVVAKDGHVVYSKAFGHHTYDARRSPPVRTTDLFDIASVTKVAATTLAVMRLREEGHLSLGQTLGEYLRQGAAFQIGRIKIRDLLLHNSGLQAQMPISRYYSARNVPSRGCNDFFCRVRRGRYNVKVADGLFLRSDLQDTILRRMYRLPVARQSFRYSDVNYFLLQKIVESKTGKPLDQYVERNFYQPLGLRRTLYHPLRKFTRKQVIPTENDRNWRKTLVHGYVHDPAAALMSGVGGNAGVFSNAEDMAMLFQMLLNGGTYGGVRFLEEQTIKDFTQAKYNNHRGLGFDKPVRRQYPSYSRHSSPQSYGHTGFTGTCVWVDPEARLVYVFLSNRVYPNARNGKIFTSLVRSRIHEVVYDALGSFKMELPQLAVEEGVDEELEDGADGG
jgi:CubicO group peptidase (beta-lactamase class C family)